jgi:outer membrane protein assembly factor BamB
VKWKLELPETGQNPPVVVGGRVFFSTMKPVEQDSELGQDVVAWCCDAETGKVLWQRELPGKYPMRLSGNFGDSTSPAAVTDGERVVFISSSGRVSCFDYEGTQLWTREFLTVNRTQAFLHNGYVVLTRQIYEPEKGGFSHEHKNLPQDKWTQLHCLKLADGSDGWTSTCGVNMGNHVIPQKLSDGRSVVVVGRGGGHSPPEKPEGISMIDLADGGTIWSLELPGFTSTQSYPVQNDRLSIFHKDQHLLIDALSGKVMRTDGIGRNVTVRRRVGSAWEKVVETVVGKKPRMITQGSDLQVGEYHYYRHYLRPWVGRVHVPTGKVEYLEMPLQVARKPGEADKTLWYKPPKNKKDKFEFQTLVPNAVTNSRGFQVMGDKRSSGNGWGHTASPPAIVAGDHIYFTTQSGLVYVIRWAASTLDGSAVVAINDLGPLGEAYTRASVTPANGRIYARTIKAVYCFGE